MNKLYIFVQNHGAHGASIAVAENEEQARQMMENNEFENSVGLNYYQKNEPVHQLPIDKAVEIYGSR